MSSWFADLDVVEWIALTGGIIGALGGAAGVVGAITGFHSNKIAQDAREDAQAANQLSAESNDLATESNRIAVDANKLSEEANTLVARTHELATERHDVRWDLDWVHPTEIRLTNLGDDEALRVKASINVHGHEYPMRADHVPGGGFLSFFIAAQGEEALAELRAEEARASRNPYGLGPQNLLAGQLSVSFHVVWETSLGKQLSHSEEPGFLSCEDTGRH